MCSESSRGLGQHGLEASFSNEEPLRAQYLVLRRLGQGGFGQVRLAYHRLTGMEVAVKVVKKGECNFLSGSEVDLMRALDHLQVIQLFQVVEGQQHIFLVMDTQPEDRCGAASSTRGTCGRRRPGGCSGRWRAQCAIATHGASLTGT
jgi:hypothetical protein